MNPQLININFIKLICSYFRIIMYIIYIDYSRHFYFHIYFCFNFIKNLIFIFIFLLIYPIRYKMYHIFLSKIDAVKINIYFLYFISPIILMNIFAAKIAQNKQVVRVVKKIKLIKKYSSFPDIPGAINFQLVRAL